MTRITGVVTDKGTIEAEYVVIACGVLVEPHRQHGRYVHPACARRAPDG